LIFTFGHWRFEVRLLGMATPITKRGPKKTTDKSMDKPIWRKCDKCEMFGGTDSFGDSCCRNCGRIADMEKRSETQEKRICDLESRLEQLAEKLDKFTAREEAEMACRPIIEKPEAWTEIVKKRVNEELREVTQKVQVVEKRIALQAEEDKMKERKKSNVIIHRMAESQAAEDKDRNAEDRKSVINLLNNVLNVPCEDKVDIKKVFRLGKPSTEGKQRPLLIEFRDAAIKNRVLENLSKLRDADEQLRQISVTHDMTEGEREQCRELVKECRERQQQDVSGEWKYQVRGLPGDMRIVKLKK